MMPISKTLSQSIKGDSVTIAKPTFISIIKESRKCDSLRVAYNKKNILFESLVESSLSTYSEFMKERAEKKIAIVARDEAYDEMKRITSKKWAISVSIGAAITGETKVVPAIMLGLSYSIIRF